MTDTIESLRAQHAELGRRIEALEKERGEEWPKEDDVFYVIVDDGQILDDEWDGGAYHSRLRDVGNCYRTEAEAKRGHLAATAMRLLRQWADEDAVANPNLRKGWRCYLDGSYFGPYFTTSAARDRAQAALTQEQLEALA